jgi:hypothetical protein
MNLREGTRRLALLLGVVGVILGGFASYVELQTVLNRRALHNRFEQLATSDVVQQERKRLQAEPNDWQTISPQIDPKTGERVTPQPGQVDYDALAKKYGGTSDAANPSNTLPADFNGWEVTVNKGGIGTIFWGKNLAIASIETDDGQRLYPTPAPTLWSYLLIAILPVLGFFVPWGVVRSVGWVGAGFVLSSR